MTRTIDADFLKRRLQMLPMKLINGELYLGTHAIWGNIDDMPTVNAIPVEWITKYVNASGTSSFEQDIIREMVLAWISERKDDE